MYYLKKLCSKKEEQNLLDWGKMTGEQKKHRIKELWGKARTFHNEV
jgi:hypothetical protein